MSLTVTQVVPDRRFRRESGSVPAAGPPPGKLIPIHRSPPPRGPPISLPLKPRSPVPRSPVPRSPVPRSPVPRSPVPRSPVPRSPVPRSPVPPTPRPPMPRALAVPSAAQPAAAPDLWPAVPRPVPRRAALRALPRPGACRAACRAVPCPRHVACRAACCAPGVSRAVPPAVPRAGRRRMPSGAPGRLPPMPGSRSRCPCHGVSCCSAVRPPRVVIPLAADRGSLFCVSTAPQSPSAMVEAQAGRSCDLVFPMATVGAHLWSSV
jgi:hypothetical protein